METSKDSIERGMAGFWDAKFPRRVAAKRALAAGLAMPTLFHRAFTRDTTAHFDRLTPSMNPFGGVSAANAVQNGEMIIWAAGDSMMWGQGLSRQDKFAFIAAKAIASERGQSISIDYDSEQEPEWFLPRSGAKLSAKSATFAPAGTKGVTIDVRLPSGGQISAIDGDRTDFVFRFPDFFPTDNDVEAFLSGKDESAARQLFGEIPSTFPTITAQVKSIPDEVGPTIDVLLLNGSANDIDFADVLDPQQGPSPAEIVSQAADFAYTSLVEVLKQAREKCPNAVIIVPGYFKPLSDDSSQEDIEELFKYMADLDLHERVINELLTGPTGYLPELFLLGLFIETSDELADQSVDRANFAYNLGLMLMRKAVTDIFESEFRGPGVYYAHPSFDAENSVFAETPFLHEGYKAPTNPSHPVQDAALVSRINRFNRLRRFGDLGELDTLIGRYWLNPNLVTADAVREQVQSFLANPPREGWPITLEDAFDNILDDFSNANLNALEEESQREFALLRRARMASFLHPNKPGDARYAEVITDRYRRHRWRQLRPQLSALAANSEQWRVGKTLRRYGLDPSTGVRACIEHNVVDSLAVETTTLRPPDSGGDHPSPMTVRVGEGREWTTLNLLNPFTEVTARDVFCFDPGGHLRLEDIEFFEIDLPRFEGGELDSVTLILNGRAVFDARGTDAERDGSRWRFAYPA